MALWNRTSSKPEPKPRLEPWEYAKQVTEAQWKSGELPLGWYCYTPNNVVWIGLKPDDDCTRLISSPAMQRPQDLDELAGDPDGADPAPGANPKERILRGAYETDSGQQRSDCHHAGTRA